MNPFLPLQWLLWGAVAAVLVGEVMAWRTRRRTGQPSRWSRRLRWIALVLSVAAVAWLGVVLLDFLHFMRA